MKNRGVSKKKEATSISGGLATQEDAAQQGLLSGGSLQQTVRTDIPVVILAMMMLMAMAMAMAMMMVTVMVMMMMTPSPVPTR